MDINSDLAVVLSPPTNIDLNAYQPFDESYENALDGILSNEVSFNNSFDEYSGDGGDNGDYENGLAANASRARRGRSDTRARLSGQKMSHYFFPSGDGSGGKKSAGLTQMTITRIDAESESDSEPNTDPEPKAGPARENATTASLETLNFDGDMKVSAVPQNDGMADVFVDDEVLPQDDIHYASIGCDKQAQLNEFVKLHPFTINGGYPVRRHARRQYIHELCGKASELGMDEASIGEFVKYFKKFYLEVWAEGCSIHNDEPEASEFGGEFDDEKLKKKRKRKKRDSGKPKKIKRNKHKMTDVEGSIAPQVAAEDRVVDVEDKINVLPPPDGYDALRDTTHQSGPHDVGLRHEDVIPDPSSALLNPEAQRSGHGDLEREANPHPLDHDFVGTETSRTRVEMNVQYPQYFDNMGPGLRDLPFALDDGKDEKLINREDTCKPDTNLVGASKNTANESTAEQNNEGEEVNTTSIETENAFPGKKQSKKEKKRQRRRRYKENKAARKKQMQSELLSKPQPETQRTQAEEQCEDNRPNQDTSIDSILETEDLHRVLTGEEVRSKYFMDPQKKKARKESCLCNRNDHVERNPIVDGTLKLLKAFGLPPDFLCPDSDSSLSDAPSDLSSNTCSPSINIISPVPEVIPTTPTKKPPVNKPRPRVPKISPYFPNPLVEPDSCLPFPPIDAPSFGLIQEQLAHDPFRFLIATIFLNRTRGGVAIPVLFQVFSRYPTAEAMAAADLSELVRMIHSLGFQNQRAKKCIGLAQAWIVHPPTKGRRYRELNYPRKSDGRDIGPDECIDDDDPRMAWEVAHLPGVGVYSLDSWRIFCRDELRGLAQDWRGRGAQAPDFVPEWKSVLPYDKELRAYLTWMWLKEGWVWNRETGEKTMASEKMMRAARRGGVAHEQDGNWVLEMSPVKKAANGLT